MKILFICKSNAGRSQMAEAIFHSLTNKDEASSAGTNVEEENMAGQSPGAGVIDSLKEIGIDISTCKRKQVTPKMVKDADKVIVLLQKRERDVYLPGYILNSEKTEYWDIEDMRYSTDPNFHRNIREQIEKRVNVLVKDLNNQRM